MNAFQDTFSDRLKTAAEAKRALLQKMRPKAAATDPHFDSRQALRDQELAQVRQARADAKQATRDAAAHAAALIQAEQDAIAAAALEAKRGARKERKALTAAEQKAKRDARYAARKAR